MDYEAEKLRAYAMARAVADACVLSSGGVSAVAGRGGRGAGGAPARSDSDGSYQSNSYPSPWPEPYDASGDSDSDTSHANRDLRAMADRYQTVGRGEPVVGAVADVRGDGVSDVLRARGEPVRREAGAKMTPREAADALVREAQADGEYEPLSRVPGLIDEIRRERDDLRERLTAIETMHRAWAQLDRNALWFALRHYLETGDTR